MHKKVGFFLAATAMASPLAAQDVLVIRRVVSAPMDTSPEEGGVENPDTDGTPSPQPTPTPSPTVTYTWDEGEYSAWSTTCGQDAVRTRSVTCVDNQGTPANESMCTGDKPALQEGPMLNLSECGSKLVNGGFEDDVAWSGAGSIVTTLPRTGTRNLYLPSRNRPHEQLIETIPGVKYKLNFWSARNDVYDIRYYFRVRATTSDNRLITDTMIPNHAATRVYEPASFEWVAQSSKTKIQFVVTYNGGSFGVHIDDVTLSAIQ